ncbi:MAG TPA: hypothetical protein DCQ98_11735 [Planctomycetaceae bacterium]|nr:hypothetical protein [Planctomycetaceae bacterium]
MIALRRDGQRRIEGKNGGTKDLLDRVARSRRSTAMFDPSQFAGPTSSADRLSLSELSCYAAGVRPLMTRGRGEQYDERGAPTCLFPRVSPHLSLSRLGRPPIDAEAFRTNRVRQTIGFGP